MKKSLRLIMAISFAATGLLAVATLPASGATHKVVCYRLVHNKVKSARFNNRCTKPWTRTKPKPAVTAEPRQFTAIALRDLESAPGIVLHSPMLAKAVSGKAEVEESVKIAHEVQSASSYTTIVATPHFVFELFDCDADGYPMEGLWLRQLDEQGRVTELTVMLRPYPAVTVLRNRARALAQSTLLADSAYWELPNAA